MSEIPELHTWRYTDPREYLARIRHGLEGLPPLIITVAITGGVQGSEANPALPETPEDQAQSTFDAWNAGASMVHIHARRAENLGATSHETGRYLEVNRLIRERCPDIVINNTMAGDLLETPGGHCRFEVGSLAANPEVVALDCGPVAYRLRLGKRVAPLQGRDTEVVVDDAFVTTYGELESLVDEMQALGIKPEFELFNSGQYSVLDELLKRPSVSEPHLVQFVLGAQNADYATPMDLLHMVERLPPASVFSVVGIGPSQLSLTTMAILLGGNVRVGMEDSVYFARGEKATSNAQFVDRVVTIARALGRRVASPEQARQLMGLQPTPSAYPSEIVAAVGVRTPGMSEPIEEESR